MLKRLLFLLLLSHVAWAQMGPGGYIYVQTISNDGNVTNNNDWPRHIIPGGTVRAQFQPVYERDNIASWSAVQVGDFAEVTFTLASGTTSMVSGDVFVVEDPSESDVMCVVDTVPSSTTFTFNSSTCDSGATYTAVGSGTFPAGTVIEKKEGPGMDPRGTFEVVDTGTTNGNYYIESLDHQRSSSSDSGCNMNLHSTACYQEHPVLEHEPAFGVFVHIDPTLVPACSQTGTLQAGNRVLKSTIQFSVKFTSDQDPTKSNTRNFLVCATGAGSGHNVIPWINPAYAWSYPNEQHQMMAENFGNADKYGSVTITSDDGLGDATLETFPATSGDAFIQHAGAVKPEFIFHSGTKKDGYTITWCADSDPTQCVPARRYVDTQDKPAGNVDRVQQTPCGTDPIMTAAGGETYVIDPTATPGPNTFNRLQDAPTQSYPWGSTFIVHPGTYVEYWQFGTATNWADHQNDLTVPMLHICGIADPTTGAMPVEDGANATGNANVNQFIGEGHLLTFYGATSTPNYDVYTGNVQGSHGVLVTGITFEHDNANYSHYAPGDPGTGSLIPYLDGEAVRMLAVQRYAVLGTRSILVSNPYFDNGNWDGGYQRFASIDGWWEGNHCEGYGNNGRSTEHCYYMQGWRDYVVGALEEGTIPDNQGTGFFSFRPVKSFYLYGRGYPNTAEGYGSGSQIGGGAEKQDNQRYFSLDYLYGPTQGYDGDCGNSDGPYPAVKCNNGDGPLFGGMDTVAALSEEAWTSFFVMGSAFHPTSGNCDTGIEQTHSDNGLEVGANLYYVNNIIDCADKNGGGIAFFEGTRFQNGGHIQDLMMIDWNQMESNNNIFWWNDNSTCANFGSLPSPRPMDKINWNTNIVHPSQFSPTSTNIQQAYGSAGFGSCTTGLNRASIAVQYTGMVPVEMKFGGWNSANFIMPSTKPYDPVTLAPANPAALNAASVPLYPASLYPVVFNAADNNAQLTRRTQIDANNFPTTIGSADGTGPVLTSITLSPAGPLTLEYPGTVSLTATCEFSDGSSETCSSPVWASDSASCTVTSGLVQSTMTPGTCNVTAAEGAVTSSPVVITVSEPPPAYSRFGAGARVSGSVRLQ